MGGRLRKSLILLGCWIIIAVMTSGSQQPVFAQSSNTMVLPTIDVFATTPLYGTGVDVDKVPASVTTVRSGAIDRVKSASVVNALAQSASSVSVSEVSGNSFQPDVKFRGFDASPILGTPQGLAVYQNGMRLNEAFGDTVNWDLIPTIAVRSIDIVSNNPAFGLNALGGALSVHMKDGFSDPGGTLDVMAGSYGRLQSSFQYGRQVGNFAIYGALERAHDGGFRQFSHSEIRRGYGDLGYKANGNEFHLSLGFADNNFGATASAPIELLQNNFGSVYTNPQTVQNQMASVNATTNIGLSQDWSLDGAVHFRSFQQASVDGNSSNAAPCAVDAALLCYNGAASANGLNGVQLNNPFAATALLGEIDRTKNRSNSVGATLQATNTTKLFGHDNHFVVGGSLDYNSTQLAVTAELGTIQPNYSILGSGVYLGASGNPVSVGPIRLHSSSLYSGLYTQDAFDVNDKLTVSAGARLNLAHVQMIDQIGSSLNGNANFVRANPMLGATYKITPEWTAYAGYSEANRAPTPSELGCADPARPCILAAFLVSDPPLKQVVARTFEAGVRGAHDFGADTDTLSWKMGVFHTDNQNDILNIPSPLQPGFGYFQNVGKTRRQGVELEAKFTARKFRLFANYTYTDATFRSALTLPSQSPYADANGNIEVAVGNQIPMIPRQQLKLGGTYDFTRALTIGTDIQATGQQRFAGDASNQARMLPGFVVVNADASYKISEHFQIYARAENLLGRRYYTFGNFFALNNVPNYANGGVAFVDPRSVSPGRPQAFYAGLKATF